MSHPKYLMEIRSFDRDDGWVNLATLSVRPVDAAVMVANSVGLPLTELEASVRSVVFTASSESGDTSVSGSGKTELEACEDFITKASRKQ